MTIEEKILALLLTGKATISTNKLVLFVWDDCGETVFEVTKDYTMQEYIEMESKDVKPAQLYQGTSFKRALNVLANSIK